MTLETGSVLNTSRPAATESKHAKGKAGDAQGAGGPGGFMSILAALDTVELTAPCAVDSALPTSDPVAHAFAALQSPASVLKGASRPSEVATLGDLANDVDLTATETDLEKFLLNSDIEVGSIGGSAPVDLPWQPELPVDTSALLAQAAHWNAVPLETAGQSKPSDVTGVPSKLAGPAKLHFGPEKTEVIAPGGAMLGEAASEVKGKVAKAQKDTFARLASAQAALADAIVPNNPAAEARQAQALQRVVETPQNSIASALTNAIVAAAPALREDMGRERSVFRSNGPEVATPGQTYMQSASTVSFTNDPVPVTAMDTFVAEKVAYWISNDVQKAEMKLDGIGELPVEVSIRMQGNEAHIAFRSDELQARSALENASQHLKEMLQREGVVLSGVSVSTAGAGDGGGQERKSRQGARQSGVVSMQPVSTDSVAGSRRSTGGALDLFV